LTTWWRLGFSHGHSAICSARFELGCNDGAALRIKQPPQRLKAEQQATGHLVGSRCGGDVLVGRQDIAQATVIVVRHLDRKTENAFSATVVCQPFQGTATECEVLRASNAAVDRWAGATDHNATERKGQREPRGFSATPARRGIRGELAVWARTRTATGFCKAPASDGACLRRHHPSACSGVKALRTRKRRYAASRHALLAFRSLDPFRPLREADRRRRDEEGPFPIRTTKGR
jgi:hypothetical protein